MLAKKNVEGRNRRGCDRVGIRNWRRIAAWRNASRQIVFPVRVAILHSTCEAHYFKTSIQIPDK